jgi:hypothetical protein
MNFVRGLALAKACQRRFCERSSRVGLFAQLLEGLLAAAHLKKVDG